MRTWICFLALPLYFWEGSILLWLTVTVTVSVWHDSRWRQEFSPVFYVSPSPFLFKIDNKLFNLITFPNQFFCVCSNAWSDTSHTSTHCAPFIHLNYFDLCSTTDGRFAVVRRSIVCWRTLLHRRVEDEFKFHIDGTKYQPIESSTSSLKSQQ